MKKVLPKQVRKYFLYVWVLEEKVLNTNGGSRHWLSSILYLQQYHHHHHSAFAFAAIVSNASLDRAWNSSSIEVHEWSYIRKKLRSSYGFCTWAKIIIPCYIAAAAKYYLAAISYEFQNNLRNYTTIKLFFEFMTIDPSIIHLKFRMLPFLPISIHHSANHDTY